MGKHSILGHTFQTLLLLACLRLSGIDAPHTYEGSLNGDTFRDYVAKILVPTLQPGEVLILDNSSAHTVAGILDLIYAKGVYVVFLVQYLSDLNPIELAWSKLKSILRKLKVRASEELQFVLQMAMAAITTADIKNWFTHDGYHC